MQPLNKDKVDNIVKAAWLYYISGKNQNEVAQLMGISRPVAQRLIAQAKEEGYVTININHTLSQCFIYNDLLKQKYNLDNCHVVPYSDDLGIDPTQNVAVGGASVMTEYLSNDKSQVIAIGSGKSLKLSLKNIQQLDRPQHKCISLISALNTHGRCNYYDDVPLLLARKIQSAYYQLPAPRYSKTLKEAKDWHASSLYKDIMQQAKDADVCFIGVGNLGKLSPIVKDHFITPQQSEELKQSGAIGEILGRFFDIDGNVIKHEINQRVTSIDIRKNNQVIGIVAGEEKQIATRAALKGGWLTGLVTDEPMAKWLLSQ